MKKIINIKIVSMKNIVLFIGLLILMFSTQCKKEIILKDGIGASINDKNVEINEVVFTEEEDGLRIYLIVNEKLINIYTNSRNVGSYSTEGEDNKSFVIFSQNGHNYPPSSGSFEITENSNNTYSGSFNYHVNLISSEIDIKCIFEQIETTDFLPMIEGTYIGIADEPYSNEYLRFHDYNSKVIIQTENDTSDLAIVSNDASFQAWVYYNISAGYAMSQRTDEQTGEILIDRKINIFGVYENNPLIVAQVNLKEPITLGILGSYFFIKE